MDANHKPAIAEVRAIDGYCSIPGKEEASMLAIDTKSRFTRASAGSIKPPVSIGEAPPPASTAGSSTHPVLAEMSYMLLREAAQIHASRKARDQELEELSEMDDE